MSKARNKEIIESAVETIDNETGEIVTTEATAVVPHAIPKGFKVKALVTMPTLVLKTHNAEYAVRFDSAMRQSKVAPKPGEKPALVADVTNLMDGKQYTLLVPSVVEKNLEQHAPIVMNEAGVITEQGYVGKSFYIVNDGKRKEGQRYVNYSIAEIEAE